MIWIICLGILIVVGIWWKLTTDHREQLASLVECQRVWRTVDLAAAAALFDKDDEAYLQEQLSFLAWYKVKWYRTIAAWEYLSDISFNARLVILIAQFSIQEHNESSATYERLVPEAVRLRGMLATVKAKLILGLVLPGLSPQTANAFNTYEMLQSRAPMAA